MRWFTMVLMGSVWMSYVAQACWAQQTGATLATQARWVQFEVILGRVTALNARYGQTKSTTIGDPLVGVRESFSVTVNGTVPTVNYELENEHEILRIAFVDGDNVTIHRQPRDQSGVVGLYFRQPPLGKVTLVVGAGPSRRQVAAEGLWHLMLAEPELCRTYLLPVLESLRPDWNLAQTADQMPGAIMRVAATDVLSQHGGWEQLVAQLANPNFSHRQAADQELRRMGQPVLSYLSRLDPQSLDTEQRRRVRNIIASMTVDEGDTPERVAAWSVEDKAMWLILLDDQDALVRETAIGHLRQISPRPLEFDAAADPERRQEQIQRLRALLGLR